MTIGGRNCTAVYHLSSRQVICTVPPGAGKSLEVQFTNVLDTTASSEVEFSYEEPMLD